ncbi:hypothetical protein [Mucilaginibacter celer]|uniref:Uncharacterized protein n=1 Tax=Mucilaginibacter celer TaxID=2305508 RepID=A0A494VUE1_9SPHI|nr:hypothetical protein [Mucilaginibacter celer]AYL94572.1 hypothetical protein HYN43_004325 [Mucilaginibacter celer]
MKPFFITIAYNLHLIVLPESEAHIDGHPVLTYSYSIFRREPSVLNISENYDALLQTTKKNNPNYLGHINFEQPGKVFNYIADGHEALSRAEVEDVIEEINRYRDTPQLWSI